MEKTSLQLWAKANQPSEQISAHKGYWNQIIFVRDTLASLITTFEVVGGQRVQAEASAIGSHRSRSITLPVYEYILRDGTVLTMRGNFHDWVISVHSPTPVTAEFFPLFDPCDGDGLDVCYCEGFPANRVYGPYARDHQKFTARVEGQYDLYTLIFLLCQSKVA